MIVLKTNDGKDGVWISMGESYHEMSLWYPIMWSLKMLKGSNSILPVGFAKVTPLVRFYLFLFLICNEVLSSLMLKGLSDGTVTGAKASRLGPQISHLLFVDDCILFGEASIHGAHNLKDILQIYECCSGQYVNFDKSTVFFSSNTS